MVIDRKKPINDAELIPRLLNKDENAYRTLVNAYQNMMLALAKTIVGPAICDEVVQETWLAVFRTLSKFERRSSLKTWILRIVANTAKSRLRHEHRTISMGSLLEDDIPASLKDRLDGRGHWLKTSGPGTWHQDTPDAILTSEELQSVLEAELLKLPPLQQSVITLRDMEGLKINEICKILDVSESNFRVLVHRARKKLRLVIEQFGTR